MEKVSQRAVDFAAQDEQEMPFTSPRVLMNN